MAQLELSVVLNLANFRTQLGKLAQASAAYYYPINLTIDKQAFKKQLAALGNIKTTLNINDSQIDAARARIGTLNKSLATLRRATSTPIVIETRYKATGDVPAARTQAKKAVTTAVKGQDLVDTASYAELQKLYKFANAAGLQFEQLKRGAASSTADLKRVLGPAFREIGSNVLAGIKTGLANADSELAKIAQGMGSGLISKTKNALGIKSPSRPFMEIGKNVVAGLEIGLENFDALQAKMVGKMREFVAVMRMEAAKIQGISMSPGMSQSAGSHGSRQYMSPIGPLSEGSKEPWAFSQYRYQPFMAQPGQTRGAGVRPMRERFPFAAAPSIMGTTTSPGMLGASFPALPSAGMTGGNAVRQAQLQSRMAAAYARSAAREASVLGESQMNARVSGQVPLGDPTPRLPAGNRGGALALRGAGAQTPLSLDYYKNAFKYSEALKVADASTRNFSASQIPLIGGIKNLAGEFGQAAKQVLLYGTAYKGLAFLTSLPGQILNAAKSQQQFANGLKVATQDTGTFAKELLYVDNVQRAFGLNLETTRTGFTRLYASMAPTGFDSGSIEKLFTGISAATASLQLTPDKAERVIYAFGQMASKGQIMSEELKGQLGDVLPGALAIFSKAAGMSVKEFSKAMEDGEFVGNRFREVFAKVSDELMNRFGTGAQAAGRSLQGLINTVGGDFQRTLESFAPLANSAAQAILGPLGGSLKQLAISAQIATGEIERVFMQLKESQQELKDLRDSAGTDGIITAKETEQIRAAEQNVAALTAKYKSLQQAASDPAIARQAQDITKFTEELGKAGTFVMNVAKAIGGMLSPVLNFLGTNLTTVISLITSFYIGFQTARLAAMALMGVLLLYRTLSAILGFGPAALSANALATAFNGLGIAATGAQVKVIGLRLALTALVASTVIGAVVGGIMLIAGAFASMRDRAKEASQSSRDAAKAAIDAAQTGGVAQAAMSVQTILGESRKSAAARKALEGIMARSTKAQRAGIEPMSLTMEESVALKGSSLTKGMVKPAIGGKPQIRVPSKGDAAAIVRQFGSVAGQDDLNLREAKSALATAQKVAKEVGLNMPTPGATPPEPTGGGATSSGAGAKPEKERESQIPQLTLALEKTKELSGIEMLIVNAQLRSNTAQLSSLELLKQLVEFKYEAKALGLEDLTTEERALKYKEIRLRREQAIFENQLQLQISLKKERDEIQQGFSATLAGYQQEANYQQMYLDLISQGVLPSLAKVRVEAEKAFAEGEKQLNQSIEQQEANIAGLAVTIEALKLEKNLTPEKQKQLEADEKRLEILKEDLRLRGLLKGTAPERKAAAIDAAERGLAPKTDAQSISATISQLQDEIRSLTSISNIAITSAEGIGSAFATSFKGLIDGSMSAKEALGSFFKSVADMFLEMAAQIIAKQITMIILQTILKALGAVAGGGGAMPGAAPQMTPDAIVTPTGFSGQFAGIAGNGATFANGIASFARGGAFSNSIVSSPTMFKFADGGAMRTGLMGEAGPEAIMPLSRGADGSLGVQANGLREAMDRQQGGANGSPVLNMSFQSTSINGVEYVSRDQLESAMAETRRNATRDGAKRGMTMTLDRIQNSSSTRRKVGI